MAIYRGSTLLPNFTLGRTVINKVYLGDIQIYPLTNNLVPPVTDGLLIYMDARTYISKSVIWNNLAPTGSIYDFTMKNNTLNYTAITQQGNMLNMSVQGWGTCKTNPFVSMAAGGSYQVTLLATYKGSNQASMRYVAGQYSSTSTPGYYLSLDSNMGVNASIRGSVGGTSGTVQTEAGKSVLYGLIADVYDGGNVTIYKDGVKGRTSTITKPYAGNFGPFEVMRAGGAYNSGFLGSVYLYDRILTDEELELIRQYEISAGRY